MTEEKSLNCRDCKEDFVFSSGEQSFYAEKGFNPPVRCKTCRDHKKAQQGQQVQGHQRTASAAPQAPARVTPEVYRASPARVASSARVETNEDFDSERRRNRRVHKSRRRYEEENGDDYDY